MDLELSGRRAVVTGGGSGIGRAIATELAREGCRVAIVGRRPEPLAEAADGISRDAGGGQVIAVPGDTGDDASVQQVARTLQESFGGVDILVNVAAENPAQPDGPGYNQVTDEQFMRQLNVKVIGYLRMARAVAPFMIEQGWGRIINISGIGVRRTVTVVNSVRNAGVTALTKNLADELGPQGVNVTALYPGYTMSSTYRSRLEQEARDAGVTFEEHIAEIDTLNAIDRFVQPEEIGWVAAFLASPKSVTISGDPIPVGGGFLGTINY